MPIAPGEVGADLPPGVRLDSTDPRDVARRFRMMLEELGPTFVKIGQILSTRPDLLSPALTTELARLQDQALAIPFAEVQAAVEQGLGKGLEEVFVEFSRVPLASASMAQTHLATLPDGTRVVVKVQRPNIADVMRADLDLLHIFARLLEATVSEMELYAPAEIVSVLDEALSSELDFGIEASNLESIAECFRASEEIRVPKIHRALSGRTVLTMEYVEGRRVADLEIGSEAAVFCARALIRAYYRMIFEHGTFHGDPHPGNLILADDGRLTLIDFGLCGFLSTMQRDRLVALILSVIAGDIDTVSRTLVRMGRPLGPVAMQDFKAEVASVRDRYLKRNLRDIDLAAFLDECFGAAQHHRIRVATDYSVLSKAMVTMEGVVRTLAPELDMAEEAQPLQARLLEEQYSPDRLSQIAIASAFHLGNFVREVPDQVSQVLGELESGRLEVSVRHDGTQRLITEINRQTTRLFMAIVCAALIIATPTFLAHEPWWAWGRVPVLTSLCALTATSLAFWGLLWHVMGGRARDWRIPLRPLLRLMGKR